MRVPPMVLDLAAAVGARGSELLDAEGKEAARAQRRMGRTKRRLERAEVSERVDADDGF